MGIRTTVSLDDDVLECVRQESRSRGVSFRQTLNDLLRCALAAQNQIAHRRSFHVKATPFGLLGGLSYDNVESLVEHAEGIDHR